MVNLSYKTYCHATISIIAENIPRCLNSVANKLYIWYSFIGYVSGNLAEMHIRKEGFSMNERQGLIVYVHQMKHAKSLRKYGHVNFISRKLKYVVIYCNRDEIESLKNKIQRLPFVKDVVESYRPLLKTEFENSKPDKAKEYDYKVGL